MGKLSLPRSFWPKALPLHPPHVHVGEAGPRWCLPLEELAGIGGRRGANVDKPKWASPLGPRNGHRELKALPTVCSKASRDFFASFGLIPFENGRQPQPGRSRVAGTDVAAGAGGGATSPRWPAEGQKFAEPYGPRQNQRQKTVIGPQRWSVSTPLI